MIVRLWRTLVERSRRNDYEHNERNRSTPMFLEQPGCLGVQAVRETSRSEEHTSELQSHHELVCRLLLEKKKRLVEQHTEDIVLGLSLHRSLSSDLRVFRLLREHPRSTLFPYTTLFRSMIVRLWRTLVERSRRNDYEHNERNRSTPMFLEQPGCLGVQAVRETS